MLLLATQKILVLTVVFVSRAFSNSIGAPTPPQHCLHKSLLSTSLACSSIGTGDLASSIHHDLAPISVDPYYQFLPWSYKPVCTGYLQSIGSKLCVYTNASFSNGRGISIFTTPQIAKQFAALPPFQRPTALNGINEYEVLWQTQQLEGKGVGMLASQRLNRGDLITAHTPVLLVYRETELSMQERERYLRMAINQLPPTTRKAYLSLSVVFGDPSLIVQDILKANTFEIEIGGHMHLALFPEVGLVLSFCD
jgi:hypothetical protein